MLSTIDHPTNVGFIFQGDMTFSQIYILFIVCKKIKLRADLTLYLLYSKLLPTEIDMRIIANLR